MQLQNDYDTYKKKAADDQSQANKLVYMWSITHYYCISYNDTIGQESAGCFGEGDEGAND